MTERQKRFFGDILTEKDVKRIRKEIEREEKRLKREKEKEYKRQVKEMLAWIRRVKKTLGKDEKKYTADNIRRID